jgi:hypothetical protein
MKKCAENETALQDHLEGARQDLGSDRSCAQGHIISQINAQLKRSSPQNYCFWYSFDASAPLTRLLVKKYSRFWIAALVASSRDQ